MLFLSYTDQTYNNLKNQPKGTVIVCYTDHTYNSLNKQPNGTVIVLAIPITLSITLINNQKVLLMS
jgi:hypothetical protein